MDCSRPGFPFLHYLLELAQTRVPWVSDAIQPPHPLLPSSFHVLNLSQHRGVFQWVRHQYFRCPKYWSFSLSISPSNEYSGLISFRIDWFALLASQGTLKSLLQHYSLKASILWCSAFFTFQLSHPYITTGKTIALNRQTFVGEVIALLFNVLSELIIAFLPWSKRLNFVAAVTICSDFGTPLKKMSLNFSTVPPSIAMKWWDQILWS